ncbi:YihY/virulence factor BrkB family protein [Dermatobacter hominis]|nr:YihY/virulence factor BrkB family protein [Dermatobacter hominis]UDY38054.1 YihY/virulence factor BrkB family protein [Dermatobacter hominis]
MLALVPALIAMVSLYGLVADPSDVTRQVEDLAGSLPASAQDLLTEQMDGLVERSSAGLSVAVIVSLALALWSASSGMQHLIEALNAAYDEDESRGAIKLRLLSLLLTAAAVVGVVVAVGLIAALPALLDSTGLGDAAQTVLNVLRWPALAVLFAVALAVLYRKAPDRDPARVQWLSWGAVIATVIWIVASLLFAVYVDRFSSLGETYGSLAGIVVLMLWLQLTAAAVLIGAEVNAELERQTTADSTVERPEPLGRRGAEAADTVGPTADEAKAEVKATGRR